MPDSPTGPAFLSRHGIGVAGWKTVTGTAQAASVRLRLNFSREIRGLSGAMSGTGSGVSVDFKVSSWKTFSTGWSVRA